MILIKILKRKDASSLIVAILLALIITQPLSSVTLPLVDKILFNHNTGSYSMGFNGNGWKDEYLSPVVWALLQIVILELLGWVYVIGRKLAVRRSK